MRTNGWVYSGNVHACCCCCWFTWFRAASFESVLQSWQLIAMQITARERNPISWGLTSLQLLLCSRWWTLTWEDYFSTRTHTGSQHCHYCNISKSYCSNNPALTHHICTLKERHSYAHAWRWAGNSMILTAAMCQLPFYKAACYFIWFHFIRRTTSGALDRAGVLSHQLFCR